MAVTTEPIRTGVSIRLDFGTSDTGVRITKNVALPTLKKTGVANFDTKVLAVTSALASLLSRSVYDVRKTSVELLEEE